MIKKNDKKMSNNNITYKSKTNDASHHTNYNNCSTGHHRPTPDDLIKHLEALARALEEDDSRTQSKKIYPNQKIKKSPLNINKIILILLSIVTIISLYVYTLIKHNSKKIIGYYEHWVTRGQSITAIANKYDVSVNEILTANPNIKNPNLIYSDSILKIPIYGEESEYNEKNNLPENLIRGIDISEYQEKIDWDKIEASYIRGEISYIIIRICENINSRQEREFCLDSKFEDNLSECNKRGIPYGLYVVSRGTTEEEIDKETAELNDYIKYRLTGKYGEKDLTYNPAMPIYATFLDDRYGAQYRLLENHNYDRCVNIMNRWCQNMKNNGLCPGIYINKRYLLEIKAYSITDLDDYPIWIAAYTYTNEVAAIECNETSTVFCDNIFSQQVTEKGKIAGIEDGPVDIDISDKSIINKNHKNSQKKDKKTTPKYSFIYKHNPYTTNNYYKCKENYYHNHQYARRLKLPQKRI